VLAVLLLSGGMTAFPQSKLVYSKDGVFGYKHTPIQPWSGYHVHDPDRPEPALVATEAGVPSDAVVLFAGKDLVEFQASKWKVANGYVEATEGSLTSLRKFGDCQIHVEWQTPNPPQEDIMNRGNNGVMLMGVFEIQIFDSYGTKIYPDGQAGAVYGQAPPLVNASRKPGDWQTYEIVFLAPRFKAGKLDQPARVTVFHNGVLIHHNQEIYGKVAHATLPKPYDPGVTEGPLAFSGHHSPVRFRNIWVRPLKVDRK
jgi:hypothetical protein